MPKVAERRLVSLSKIPYPSMTNRRSRRDFLRLPRRPRRGPGYDPRYDHLTYFDAVRTGGAVFEDAVFGCRGAAPPLMADLSLWEDRVYRWDPVGVRQVAQ